jgi:UDPglucose--hexose-1-phosphate uridylyltransferase
MENDIYIAFCPYASRFPFETWILPLEHETHFEQSPDEDIPSFAQILLVTVQKLESILDNPSYNFVFHTTPFNIQKPEHYHWHLEIIPRLTRVAGFEWGTDFYINPVPPENAAQYLREQKLK